MSVPTVVVTANLQQITGSVDAAKATFELVGFGSTVPRISGTAVIVQTTTTAIADINGNISVTIWGLDVITPSGCLYTVTFYNDQGVVVAPLSYNAFIGTATFDLSQVVPVGQIVVAAQQPNSAIPQVFTPVLHKFLTGMSSVGVFSIAQPAFTDISGIATASQLPTPTASTLGGVKSLAAVTHNFLTSIDTTGLPITAQPAAADLSNGTTGTGGAVVLATAAALTDPVINTLNVTGNSALGVSGTGGQIAGGFASPSVIRHYLGDGTGWRIEFAKRAASVDTLEAWITDGGVFNIVTGIQINGAAASGNVLRGNGTNFIPAVLAAADLSNGTTGSGHVVLDNTPTLITPNIGAATGTSLALGGAAALISTTQTGTGSIVLATSPTLVTPALGAATGTSLALGGGTVLTTTNQTGTGSIVLATSPTLVTPTLGVATATSVNKVAITAPATSATLTIANGKTLAANNSLTLAGTDGTTINLPASGNVVGTTDTQTLSGKTLQGAASGNSVTLLNYQSPTGTLTGNAADQVVFTYTLPANTMQAGKGIRITTYVNHQTGSAVITYKVNFGGVTYTTTTPTDTAVAAERYCVTLFNNAGVTNVQNGVAEVFSGGAYGIGSLSSSAIDTTAAVVITLTFNAANTQQVQGRLWMVELLQ